MSQSSLKEVKPRLLPGKDEESSEKVPAGQAIAWKLCSWYILTTFSMGKLSDMTSNNNVQSPLEFFSKSIKAGIVVV